MHLGNGIICPVTGIPMLAIAAGTAFYAFKKANFSKDRILPAVGLTALVFALQMINFSIPLTGSSGHIVGGVLLAALIGPYAAFLAMGAILLVQALFFADGGLLAYGCNLFNMGFLACFIAYPFVYKPFADKNKPVLGAILASIIALQLGSAAVVAETALSGSIKAAWSFMGLMQAIHLPIGIAEGIITGAVIRGAKFVDAKKLAIISSGVSLVLAGFIAQYASQKPDGLEWSLLNISNSVVMQTQNSLYALSEAIQAKSSVLASVSFGGILGLMAAGTLMYFVCLILNRAVVRENG